MKEDSNEDERKGREPQVCKTGKPGRASLQDGGGEECKNSRARQVGSARSPFHLGIKRPLAPFQNLFRVAMSVKGGQYWVERVRER